MKLTPKLATAIAARYDGNKDWTGRSELDRAFLDMLKSQGGLMLALTDDARFDLIRTLSDNRRARNRAIAKRQAEIAACATKA